MTFVEPLFLIAALAGAIPVLLHMINRQQASVAPFSTLRFLTISVQRTRKRKYIHDLLLLLLRMAALVLIALGLARPMLQSPASLFRSRSRTAVVIILDNSASMATTVGRDSRFARAVEVAEQLVTQLRPGDPVALLVTGGPELPIRETLYANHDVVLQALGECRVSLQGADLNGKLEQARQLLEKSKVASREIFVVTDMQARSWSEPKAPKPADRNEGVERGIPVVVVDVKQAVVPNVGISRLTLEQTATVVDVPLEASVEIVNHSPVRQSKHVEWYVDGARHSASPVIELEPGKTVHHSFVFTIDRPGAHRCEARVLDHDALTLDDRRYLSLVLRDRIRVAVVESERHPVPYLDSAFYLKEAFDVLASGWSIESNAFTLQELPQKTLSDYDVVFCVDLPAQRLGTAAALRQYVRQGGHLFWIAGENVSPEDYNELNRSAGGELLPAELAGVREDPPDAKDASHLGWLDADDEALRPLTEPASVYESVLVRKFATVKAAGQQGARVLARVGTEPLLVERRVGEGSVLWLGTTMHMDWTNLPVKPIFLPLVARLTFRLGGSGSRSEDLIAGAPWSFSARIDGAAARCELERPDGEMVVLKNPERLAILQYRDTHTAGVYHLRLTGKSGQRDLAFSVNVDPGESDGTVIARERLESLLGAESVTVVPYADDIGQTIARMRQGGGLWEVLLAGVLVALVTESLVANRATTRPSDASHTTAPEPIRATA